MLQWADGGAENFRIAGPGLDRLSPIQEGVYVMYWLVEIEVRLMNLRKITLSYIIVALTQSEGAGR